MHKIFDREVLRLRRDRIANNLRDTNFLIKYAADLLQEKLLVINHKYHDILDLGSRNNLLNQEYFYQKHSNKNITITKTDISSKVLDILSADNKVICDEENLPFKESSFDLVVSILNLHNVNDLPGCLVQIKNILRDQGVFLAVIFGGSTLNELRQSIINVGSRNNNLSPRVSPFIDVKMAGSLLQRAGFIMPVTNIEKLTVKYREPIKLMYDLKEIGESNILISRQKNLTTKKYLNDISEEYRSLFVDDEGYVPATFEFLSFTGFKN